MAKVIFAFLLAACFVKTTEGFVEGIYCGTDNCYDVLGITRDATRGEISKVYRKLARKYHPDVNKDEGTVEKFQKIAKAYEILRDEESRKDYNYMLDNPEEAYYHYYQYYKRRYTPKIDVRIVLAVTFTIISVLQYWQTGRSYDDAVRYAMQNPKFRNQAMQVIHQEGLLSANSKKPKNKKSKDERKREEERHLQEIVEDSIDIKGNHSKPSLWNVLWIQMIVSPYYFVRYVVWFAKWIWQYWIMKQEYSDNDKEYLTYKGLGFTRQYWNALDDYSKKSYMSHKLWDKETLKEYNAKIEEEHRVKQAENNRHKMWRRFMKRGGPSQMTFIEE